MKLLSQNRGTGRVGDFELNNGSGSKVETVILS